MEAEGTVAVAIVVVAVVFAEVSCLCARDLARDVTKIFNRTPAQILRLLRSSEGAVCQIEIRSIKDTCISLVKVLIVSAYLF